MLLDILQEMDLFYVIHWFRKLSRIKARFFIDAQEPVDPLLSYVHFFPMDVVVILFEGLIVLVHLDIALR